MRVNLLSILGLSLVFVGSTFAQESPAPISAPLTEEATTEAPAEETSGPQHFINVGQAQTKRSQLALLPVRFLGAPSDQAKNLTLQNEIFSTIEKDLTASAYFNMMSKDAFVESVDKGLKPAPEVPNGFDFSSWKEIGTDFLVKTGFFVTAGQLTLETYVYQVSQRQLVFGKTYSGPPKDAKTLTHEFCNDLVFALTGNKGFFLTQIAAIRSMGNGTKELFLMNWDGSGARQLTKHKTLLMYPSWSRDRRYIAYTFFPYHLKMKSRNWDLYLYDLKTGVATSLSWKKGINSAASFLPDDQSAIIRISPLGGTSDLFHLNFKELTTVQLTNGPRGSMNVEPSVSPDGKSIAFSSDRGGRPMIYVMNIDGTNVRRITHAGFNNSTPVWSPNGKKIVFGSYINSHFDLYIMDADGKNLTRLTQATKLGGRPANHEDPSFSPDGRHIMYRSDRSGTYQIYMMTVDGKNETRITHDSFSYDRPQWSPL